jgi:hypothetical protein
MSGFLQDPAFREAFDAASTEAQQKRVPMFQSVPDTTGYGNPRQVLTGQGADIIKKSLDAAVNKIKLDNPANKGAAQGVQSVRDDFLSWVDQHNPVYPVARQTFSAASTPISQMQLREQLRRELVLNNYTGVGPLNDNGYLNALAPENEANTLNKASKIASDGQNFYNKPDNVSFYDRISQFANPRDTSDFQAVANDMLREQRANNLANGVDVSPKITDTSAAGAAGAAAYAATGHGAIAVARAASDLVRRLGGRMSQAQAERVAGMLQTPQGLSQLLAEMQARQARGNAISAGVRNALAAPARVNPLVYNAASPNQQQNALGGNQQ